LLPQPDLAASNVVVRILGDVALIHARTHFSKPDGAAGIGRYTHGWIKHDGRWRCVSAHVTRG
jgi:ketosteroid isomerase-like protein